MISIELQAVQTSYIQIPTYKPLERQNTFSLLETWYEYQVLQKLTGKNFFPHNIDEFQH